MCLSNAFIKKNFVNLRAKNRHAETQTFADNILEICVIKSNDF